MNPTITFEDLSDENLIACRNAINDANWSSVFSSHCVNSAYNEFVNIFITLHNANFPLKSIIMSKKCRKPRIMSTHLRKIPPKKPAVQGFSGYKWY